MRVTRTRTIATLAALSVISAGVVGTAYSTSTASSAVVAQAEGDATTKAALRPLNNSGGHGSAEVMVSGRDLNVVLQVRRVLKDMPHAQHIHFGAKARHECPTVRDDDNADHRINTAEGQPAYGPVRVSLTKRGDTSPDSTLAVNRFPTATNGRYTYSRTIRVTQRLADRIAAGKGVLVIHGIDYNHNGKYDFRGAGKSELDPSLPAEATDPAVCGVLRVSQSSDGGLLGGLLDDLLNP